MSVSIDRDKEIHYRMRFWESLVEIIEAAKPLIITAIEEKMNDERERLQHRNPRGR